MYKSLVRWVNVPFQIKPFVKRTGTGAVIYADAIDELCYPVAATEEILDSYGAQCISSHKLYLKGTTDISVKDIVIFEGVEREIKTIQCFYRNGKVDCKVVYL